MLLTQRSCLEEPFEDEIHPRLRYVHRGLVGMANNETKDSNDSQFFITLGKYECKISHRTNSIIKYTCL